MAYMDAILKALEGLGPLGLGEREALEAMRPFADHFTLGKGEALIAHGTVPGHVAFVHQGILRHVVVDAGGDERILCFHREGEFVHDCERWARNEPTEFSVLAIEDCRVTLFPLSDVHALAAGHPGFDVIGARMMLGDRNALLAHLSMLQRFDPLHRYRYLLENDPELVRRVSVTHLAQYLGLTRETLSRVRARISEQVIS